MNFENLVRVQEIDDDAFFSNKRMLDYHQTVRMRLKVLEIIETKKVNVNKLFNTLDEYNQHIMEQYYLSNDTELRLLTKEEYDLIKEDINHE